MPSALATALRQGVETDWRRKYFSSSASSVRASGSRLRSAQARRCGDRLVSLSDSAGVFIPSLDQTRLFARARIVSFCCVALSLHKYQCEFTSRPIDESSSSSSPPRLQAHEQNTIEQEVQEFRAERGRHDHARHRGRTRRR